MKVNEVLDLLILKHELIKENMDKEIPSVIETIEDKLKFVKESPQTQQIDALNSLCQYINGSLARLNKLQDESQTMMSAIYIVSKAN